MHKDGSNQPYVQCKIYLEKSKKSLLIFVQKKREITDIMRHFIIYHPNQTSDQILRSNQGEIK